MEQPNFSERMRELLRVLDGSDAIFRNNWEKPSQIQHKGRIDLVTDTDLAIEEYLKQNLKDIVPGATFMAEESASLAKVMLSSANDRAENCLAFEIIASFEISMLPRS